MVRVVALADTHDHHDKLVIHEGDIYGSNAWMRKWFIHHPKIIVLIASTPKLKKGIKRASMRFQIHRHCVDPSTPDSRVTALMKKRCTLQSF